MRTAREALEIAIQTLCERAGLDVEEGVKGVMQTLEANGYAIVPTGPMVPRVIDIKDATIEGPVDAALFQQGKYVLIAGVDMQADPKWRPVVGDRKPDTACSVSD